MHYGVLLFVLFLLVDDICRRYGIFLGGEETAGRVKVTLESNDASPTLLSSYGKWAVRMK